MNAAPVCCPDMSDHSTRPAIPVAPIRAAYEAPRVQSLGAWAAITLLQSVPINPGSFLDPQRSRHF